MIVFAHGIAGRADLPIPGALFAAAAAMVLVLSFVWLASGWTTPRLQGRREQPLLRIPLGVDVVLGALGVLVFTVAVYAGFAGTEIGVDNLIVRLVYVAFWVGVPVVSLLFGDVFRLLSPWRAVGRVTGSLLARFGDEEATAPLPYPVRLGRWPAAAGLLGFALVELTWSNGQDPQSLAILALLYFAIQVVGQGLYGVEAWSRNGDAFGVYFGLFASLSAFRRREDGTLMRRRALTGPPGLDRPAGTIALLCVAIGSTIFDGAIEGPVLQKASPAVQDLFVSFGMTTGAALEWAFVVLLLACIAVVATIYLLGTAGLMAGGRRALAHTLIPIAAAYVVAHYFSLLAYQGQDLWRLASDPLGRGSDLFGGASSSIDYGVISATGLWYVQVAALTIGHVAALVLAHDRALSLYGSARAASRSQLNMLTLMVAFTCLGLWLLSVSNS